MNNDYKFVGLALPQAIILISKTKKITHLPNSLIILDEASVTTSPMSKTFSNRFKIIFRASRSILVDF